MFMNENIEVKAIALMPSRNASGIVPFGIKTYQMNLLINIAAINLIKRCV